MARGVQGIVAIVFILFSVALTQGEPLDCYLCSSQGTDGLSCNDPVNVENLDTETCPDTPDDPFECIKLSLTNQDGEKVTERSCAPKRIENKDICTFLIEANPEYKFDSCSTCSTSLCNSF